MPRKQKKYHYIYKTTNKVNGKYYIGMHSTSNLSDGYLGSGKKLWTSLYKYGKENHQIEFLEFLPNRKELKKREKEIVNKEVLKDPLCMNLNLGGTGGWEAANSNSEVQKRKNLKSQKIYPLSISFCVLKTHCGLVSQQNRAISTAPESAERGARDSTYAYENRYPSGGHHTIAAKPPTSARR
jgi:hypothetical protein